MHSLPSLLFEVRGPDLAVALSWLCIINCLGTGGATYRLGIVGSILILEKRTQF